MVCPALVTFDRARDVWIDEHGSACGGPDPGEFFDMLDRLAREDIAAYSRVSATYNLRGGLSHMHHGATEFWFEGWAADQPQRVKPAVVPCGVEGCSEPVYGGRSVHRPWCLDHFDGAARGTFQG